MNDNTQKTGSLFIVSAPSGAGKTSLVHAVTQQVEKLKVSISHTTRAPRLNEQTGVDYHFVDESTFKDMVKQDLFLEHAKVFDHYYGTSRDWINEQHDQGFDIIFDIDWQGAQQIKSRYTGAVSIFILPPDYQTLYSRLSGRKDDEVDIQIRMNEAKSEISHYKEYDYIIINDDFDEAVKELKAIITATNLGRCRQSAFYDKFVEQIMAQSD